MAKLKDLISDPSRKDLEKAAAKPKRPRLQRCRIIASSTPEVEKKCKELRYLEHEEKKELKTVPVLFAWGQRKRLTEADALWYQNMGAEVKYLSETEVKSLNIK